MMTRAVHAFLLALRDLPSPRVIRILAQSLALTLLIFAAAGAAIFFGVRRDRTVFKTRKTDQQDTQDQRDARRPVP